MCAPYAVQGPCKCYKVLSLDKTGDVLGLSGLLLEKQQSYCISCTQLMDNSCNQSVCEPAICRSEHMLKEEALAERKLSVRRKALELLQQAQVFECHEPFLTC